MTGVDNAVLGILAVAVAAISYGVAIVYSRIHLMKEKPLYAPSSQLLVTAIYLIPFAIFMEGPVNLFVISWEGLGALFVLSLFGTALAFVIYYKLLASSNASYLSLVTYLMPIYGVALGILFLNESLDLEAITGALLIVFGIMIANKTISLPVKKDGKKWMSTRKLQSHSPIHLNKDMSNEDLGSGQG
jgi:drug/metabolite transporter (DMT)-like permease